MNNFDKVINLMIRRGFIFQSYEIYGGLRGFYDFGHLGVLLKNNIKKFWLDFILKENNIYLLETPIITKSSVLEASGHLENFYDLLVECKSCHNRFRYDHYLDGEYGLVRKINENFLCPLCDGQLTEPKKFNLMFKTYVGPVEETSNQAFLRPETAQGIFVNFDKYIKIYRAQLPFGIAQIGKAFRNEITPKNFIFRIREFEQMEIEYFIHPDDKFDWVNYWLEKSLHWYINILGFRKENIIIYEQPKEELAHYSNKTIDICYKFPFGNGEIQGIAHRGNYDLLSHIKFSNKDLSYFDQNNNKKIIPYVIEPSWGVERLFLALFYEVYDEDEVDNEKRIILKFPPYIAPIKIAVFPLVSNKEILIKKSKEVYNYLKKYYSEIIYDENGSIGKRYRRQDEIGTPFCLTVDFRSLEDNSFTVRDRDTTKQERINFNELLDYFKNKLKFKN
ncbi:MAG: glycine--tRNA ligase [Candidatus Parcubacteria bacterium]|nr:MAG: glycine--tRNA ligase [Candidatus Parcubacteria bacterium]